MKVYYAHCLDKMQSRCVAFFKNRTQFPELASWRMAFFNHPGPVLRSDWSKEVGSIKGEAVRVKKSPMAIRMPLILAVARLNHCIHRLMVEPSAGQLVVA
ncbi:hypothetical protein [Acetobacterium sp.]|uniref:hypothetical protein n=1 Tax=Acetobacterium sp. TaxID=1872094 RepID=UPI0027185434|nr:hypothetical protein [Acetobacterium sp.]MDO9491757.1 hypothetical protein [Acetobacterium sp.]